MTFRGEKDKSSKSGSGIPADLRPEGVASVADLVLARKTLATSGGELLL